jgi:hypothetical protein
MEDQTTEQKQNYLRTEIIDKGYDPEEFSTYISSIKGEDGIDLSLWTMQELENVVKDFQLKQNHNVEQNINEEYTNSYKDNQQETETNDKHIENGNNKDNNDNVHKSNEEVHLPSHQTNFFLDESNEQNTNTNSNVNVNNKEHSAPKK